MASPGRPPVSKKILDHPDREEIISKLSSGVSPQDIFEWLSFKYATVDDKKLIPSISSIKDFQKNYLDIYAVIQEDMQKSKKALAEDTKYNELELSIQNNSAYKSLIMKTVEQELNLKETIKKVAAVLELRLGQIFDVIQEDPRDINTKLDRILIEYIDKFAIVLEKAHKISNEAPDQIVQHNITVQHIDQHTNVFYEAIKRVLAKMDVEASMLFMEAFNEELSRLKEPNLAAAKPIEERMTEVHLLNEKITERISI
jgi:hypothetical protein